MQKKSIAEYDLPAGGRDIVSAPIEIGAGEVGKLPGQNTNDLKYSGQIPNDRPDLSTGRPRRDDTKD